MKKSVLILSTTFPGLNKSNRSNSFLFTDCLCFQYAGYNVYVLTLLKKGYPKKTKFNNIFVTRFQSPFFKFTPAYNHHPLYKIKNIIELFSTCLIFVSYYFLIKKYVKQYKINFVWANWLQTGFIANIAVGKKIPVFTTIQGSDIRNSPVFINKILSKKVRNIFNIYEKDGEIKGWIKKYKFNNIIVPNVYQPKKIKLNQKRNNIAIISRLENNAYHMKFKGIGDDLFNILKKILIKYPKTSVTIIGSGSKYDYFKKLCVDFSKRIVFLGWLDDFTPFLKNASFIIGASGFGGVTFDAVPNNIPVLISKYDPIDSFWKNKQNCLIYDPFNIRNYYSVIEFAINNPNKLKQYAKKARKLFVKYVMPYKQAAPIWRNKIEKFIK